jgi:hypothetical protein
VRIFFFIVKRFYDTVTAVRHPDPRLFLVYGNENDTLSPFKLVSERLLVYKFKGTRGKGAYVIERIYIDPKTGKRQRRLEHVYSRARIKKLKDELSVVDAPFTNIGSSTQQKLVAALSEAIFDRDDRCPDGMEPQDWHFNLGRAKQLLKEKRRNSRRDLCRIANAILPPRRRVDGRLKQILCGWCRRPILFGYMLDGHKIRRRLSKDGSRFCDAACKMNRKRRPLVS